MPAGSDDETVSYPDLPRTGVGDAEDAARRLGMLIMTASGAWAGSTEPVAEGSTLDGPAGTRPAEATLFELARPLSRDFGKYELIGEIGRGGMGVVYKARQKDLDRVVAIKMIVSSHLASDDQVDRFRAEARAAAKVRSPHVVGIHEVGEFHGQHYFAMEYVAGPSLAKLLLRGPLDPEAAARLVLAVARAVDHLHAQGIVHRDLKPSNILMDELGEPHVSDFGLAKMLGGDQMTHSGAIVGTPSYMAPEQASGRGANVGPLSDIYALGAILYELLTGRPPFREESPLETLVQVLEGEPPRPGRLRTGLPRALEWICLKCLEKSPADRYPTAGALADDLGRFLKREPVEARRLGPWSRLRRWARREPALASRLGTMGICSAIIQVNRYFVESQDFGQSRRAISVVVGWALASIAFQGFLRPERWSALVRFAWAFADVAFFTALVYLSRGLGSSQVAGYFLLVAASGLWFREHLVWFTTGLAVAGYGLLVLLDHFDEAPQPLYPYHHVLFAAVLAVSGLIVAYQVKRVRALSLYYEHRPLP